MAVQLFTRSQIEERLKPYGCRMVQALPSGVEIWVTGWGETFTLTPEGPDKRYDEWAYRRVLASVIAPTMPAAWPVAPVPAPAVVAKAASSSPKK